MAEITPPSPVTPVNKELLDTQEISSSNRIATYALTGGGYGKRFFKIENSDGTLSSEIYELFDFLKYDNGTLEDHDDTIWNSTTGLSRGDDYSTIGSTSIVALYTSIPDDIEIEVDIRTNTYTNGTVLRITNGSTVLSDLTRATLNLNQNEWKHIRIKILNEQLTVENTNINEVSVTGFNRLYFRANANYTIDFKNLQIYYL